MMLAQKSPHYGSNYNNSANTWGCALELMAIFLMVSSAVFFMTVKPTAGLYNDEIYYIRSATIKLPEPEIVNRYTHLYLMKAFISTAPDSIIGTTRYAAFITIVILLLVYANGCMMARHYRRLAGSAAVLTALAALSQYRQYLGTGLADFTLAAIALAMLAVFQVASRRPQLKMCGLMLLGALLVMAFRTKEVGLCLGLLPIGLFFSGGILATQYRPCLFWLCFGLIQGVILLSVMDWFFLNDLWFWFRPSTWQACTSLATKLTISKRTAGYFVNYPTTLINGAGLLVATVYIAVPNVVVTAKDQWDALWFSWVVPIVVFAFLTFIAIFANFNQPVIPRYLLSWVPYMAVFAAPATEYLLEKVRSHLSKVVIFNCGTLIVLFLLIKISANPIVHLGWELFDFQIFIIVPLAFFCMAAISPMHWFDSYVYKFTAILLLYIWSSLPLSISTLNFMLNPIQQQNISELRWSLCRIISESIDIKYGNIIFIDKKLAINFGMESPFIASNKLSIIKGVFVDEKNVETVDLSNAILSKKFDYWFLHPDTVDQLRRNSEGAIWLQHHGVAEEKVINYPASSTDGTRRKQQVIFFFSSAHNKASHDV